MKTGMIESDKYFEGLLDGIPDELLDGISGEKDFFEDGGIGLLEMVDLPLESVECGDSHHQWDADMTGCAGLLPGQFPSHAYVDSTVWYTAPEAKTKLSPPNQLTLRPQPVSSNVSTNVPVMVGDTLTDHASITVSDSQTVSSSASVAVLMVRDKHTNHGALAVSDAQLETTSKLMPLVSLVSKTGYIPSDCSIGLPLVVEEQVVKNTAGDAISGISVEPLANAASLNGSIPKAEPISSDSFLGLPLALEDWVIEDTISSAVLDTLLESKSKLMPANVMDPKTQPTALDAMLGSPLVVKGMVKEHPVENAHSRTLPEHKHVIPVHIEPGVSLEADSLSFGIEAYASTKLLQSGSSRVQSPASVLEVSSCNSARTGSLNLKFQGVRYGKRSKRPCPKHIKNPWFHISLSSAGGPSKKTCLGRIKDKKKKIAQLPLGRTNIKDSDQRATENLLCALPTNRNDQTSVQGSVATKKCSHCEVTKTPQWREGPNGPKTLCNACGVRYRSGRLFPEYRPAASPTFTPMLHSNSHKKVIEMRKQAMQETFINHYPHKKVINTMEQAMQYADILGHPPRSPDSSLREDIPVIGHPFHLIY